MWSDTYVTASDTTDDLVCSWSVMTSGTSDTLWGVDGTSSSNVFAVGGYGGGALHYNGSGWSAITGSGITANFYDVWAASSDDIFAVGSGGAIYRYAGGSWTAMTSDITWGLNGVWGTSASDVFAVGEYGTILHYDGNAGGAWECHARNRLGNLPGRLGHIGKRCLRRGRRRRHAPLQRLVMEHQEQRHDLGISAECGAALGTTTTRWAQAARCSTTPAPHGAA